MLPAELALVARRAELMDRPPRGVPLVGGAATDVGRLMSGIAICIPGGSCLLMPAEAVCLGETTLPLVLFGLFVELVM